MTTAPPPAPPAPPHPHKAWVVLVVITLAIAAGAIAVAIFIGLHAATLGIVGAGALTLVGTVTLLLQVTRALGLTP
jgi:hypothetical protein